MKFSMRSAAFAAALTLGAGVSPGAMAATKLTVGSVNAGDYLATYISIKEGFFAKHDLDVTLQSLPGGSVLPAVQSGSTQIAGIPATNLLLGTEGGLNLRVVTGASVTRPDDKIWGLLAEKGVTGAKDLVGKKAAVPSVGGVMYLMFANYLMLNNVKVNEVKMVESPFDQVGELLKAGSIAAGMVAEPLLTRGAEVSGAKVIHYFAADFPANTVVSVYATTDKWADQNPQVMKAFVAGVNEGVAFANKNPEKAKQYLAEYSKLPPDVAANALVPALGGDVSKQQLEFWRDLMLKLGLMKKSVDVSKLQGP